MTGTKLSVAIPYRQRLDNLRLVFEGLVRQTMHRSDFEVVIGAMEYCAEYTALCRQFSDRISIVSVVSGAPFEIPRARNLAMRQASGRVVVQMDADTLLPPDALQNLWDRHFAFGQNACVVGQVVGYGNNQDGDVTSVDPLPYAHYRAALEDVRASRTPRDPRFQVEHVIPWAFAWTGLIALPMDLVRTHELYFDEDFHGWGVDDLEWGYRVCASSIPIILRQDVYALHLPHIRDSAANRRTEKANFDRFLRKWPYPDVELAHAFGDVEANALYLTYLDHLRRACGGPGRVLGSVRAVLDGTDTLLLGVVLDTEGRVLDPAVAGLLAQASAPQVCGLAGLALPHEGESVAQCRILPTLSRLPAPFLGAVRAEAGRVAKHVVEVGSAVEAQR